jgi:DNA polymerase III subunit alpha
VFQLESRGMKDLIRRLLPDRFDDIIALVALFRPGPLQSGAVDDYINRKHGREPVVYPHPEVAGVLAPTYGVMLYQEQVMEIAQVLAGFSLGQADLLRRAMGKKKPEEMAKVRQQFLDGSRRTMGSTRAWPNHIFDLMEKFSGYAFNKSHSATYALVSLQTAWLKAHYPAEFMAATLSADMQNIDKVVTLVDEVRRMGLICAAQRQPQPAIGSPAGMAEVIYGLGAVRGVGEGPVAALVAARKPMARSSSLHDFCRRVDARKVNKRVLEALIRSGAMDELAGGDEPIDLQRARLAAELADAMHGAEQAARNEALGMVDMFGGVDAMPAAPPRAAPSPPLGRRERLEGEKETLGLYLTGHPIEDYLPELRQICASDIAGLRAGKGPSWWRAGGVGAHHAQPPRRRPVLSGHRRSQRAHGGVAVHRGLRGQPQQIAKDAILLFEGEVQTDDYSGALKLKVDKVYTMEEARARFSAGVLARSVCGRDARRPAGG